MDDPNLQQAVQYAFLDLLDVVGRTSAASKKTHQRIAAFLTARATQGAAGLSAEQHPELCPVEAEVWQPCTELMGKWAETFGDRGASEVDIAGEVYQFLLSQPSRRKDGVFYTPEPLARFLVEQAFDRLGDLPPATILDPSCGSGRFLLVAFRVLRDRLGLHRDDILPRLHGIERDPFAAALARSALLAEAGLPLDRVCDVAVTTGDALVLQEPTARLPLLGFDAAGPDLILGNPPYGARLTAAEIKRCKQAYELAQGKFDIVSLFVELAGEALAPGGVLAYVLPHAFTRSGGYEATREWLLANGSISALVNTGRGFPGIELNTCALVWRKGEPRAMAQGYEARDSHFHNVGQVDGAFYVNRRAWPIYISPENLRLAQHMECEDARPLESLVKIRRGATITGLAKLTKQDEAGPDRLGIVRGRNIRRYAQLSDRPLATVSPGDLPDNAIKCVLDEPRPILQNIGDRIKATLCPAGLLPIDTVNVLMCDDPALKHYLVAYLNSALVDRYVRDLILNRATLTVHFDRPTIGVLPVRVPSPVDLDWYERTVPMVIEEQDAELMEEVEMRILEQYEIEGELASALKP